MILTIITDSNEKILIESDEFRFIEIKQDASGMCAEDFTHKDVASQCYETTFYKGHTRKNVITYSFQVAYLTNKEGKTIQKYG